MPFDFKSFWTTWGQTNALYATLAAGSGDRREKLVSLIDMGRAYTVELLRPLYKLESAVFDVLGRDRVKQMVDALALFNMVFEK
ncbi:MAG: hypothetical protein ACTTKL_06275 [Treponema sp.]